MKFKTITLFVAFIGAPPLAAATHESPCTHVCSSPSCVIANIEAWEQSNNAGCANVDGDDPGAVATTSTDCVRLDFIGIKKSARTALTCSGGSCSITGTFKCPSSAGYRITPSVSIPCPARSGQQPDVFINDANYGYGSGTYASCWWPDGHFKQAECNENTGTVYVTEW